jgi:hypothetical protein
MPTLLSDITYWLKILRLTVGDDKSEGIALAIRVYGNEAAPRAWHIIGNSCAVLFWVSASAAIYWFVTNNW